MKLDFRETAPVKVTGFSQSRWLKRKIQGHLSEAFAPWSASLERRPKSTELPKTKGPAFRINLRKEKAFPQCSVPVKVVIVVHLILV